MTVINDRVKALELLIDSGVLIYKNPKIEKEVNLLSDEYKQKYESISDEKV